MARPSTFSSLSSLASGASCGAMPAARSNCCDKGIERAVAMIGRALIAQPGMRLVRDLLGEPGGNARLADARLAGDQDDLALARPGPALPLQQIGALGLAPDEGGESRRMRSLEPALALGDAERRPGLDRLGEPLDRVPAEIAQAKAIADQPARRRGDDDPARAPPSLAAARRDWACRRPQPAPAPTPCADDIADDDEPRRDADPHGEFFARARLQARHDLGDFESGVHRPRRVVLVGAGKAEISQECRRP